jgi:Chlorophyll A-B binding protein
LHSQKDWSQQIVPDNWLEASERTPITTVEWMREAELKHGRISMLAVLGWVAVDAGVRMPGAGYESIKNSFVAHDASVANGSMTYVEEKCRSFLIP